MVAYECDQHLPKFSLVRDDLNFLANVGTLIMPEIDAVFSEFYAHGIEQCRFGQTFQNTGFG